MSKGTRLELVENEIKEKINELKILDTERDLLLNATKLQELKLNATKKNLKSLKHKITNPILFL